MNKALLSNSTNSWRTM